MTQFIELEQKLWVGVGENSMTRNFIIRTLQKNLVDRKIKEYEMDGAKSIWHKTNCKEIFVNKTQRGLSGWSRLK